MNFSRFFSATKEVCELISFTQTRIAKLHNRSDSVEFGIFSYYPTTFYETYVAWRIVKRTMLSLDKNASDGFNNAND